jgi:hypothetical protein
VYNLNGGTHVESVNCPGLRPRRDPDADRRCPRNCRHRIRDLSLPAIAWQNQGHALLCSVRAEYVPVLERRIFGDAPNIAARAQALADPGSVVVTARFPTRSRRNADHRGITNDLATTAQPTPHLKRRARWLVAVAARVSGYCQLMHESAGRYCAIRAARMRFAASAGYRKPNRELGPAGPAAKSSP